MKQQSNMLLGAALALLALALFTHHFTMLRAEALSRAVAEVVQSYAGLPEDSDLANLNDRILQAYGIVVSELPLEGAALLPPLVDKRGLEGSLALSLQRMLKLPVWVDTTGNSRHVEIRVTCKRAVLRVLARTPVAWPMLSDG